MSDVTVIGLGAMGSALARAFLGAGHAVTVWNRTADRMEPLRSRGALAARSAAEAVGASPVTVICIDNYSATRRLLTEAGLLAPLSGRTLVQLSTGTPAEARDLARWLGTCGVQVLDGAIMPYPEGIGSAEAQILFAGPAALYASTKPVLDCLGGDLRHVGHGPDDASVDQLSGHLARCAGLRGRGAGGGRLCVNAAAG
jgi:3-hydroxyisobutyrate dehydrogenase-like beta-hydroxyacid dehydrogenase